MNLSVAEIIAALANVTAEFKTPQDDLFRKSNEHILAKNKKLGIIRHKVDAKQEEEQVCEILGCNKVFANAQIYQTHYNTQHRHRCSACRRVFPTAHLLDLHITETHDSYFAVLLERGKAIFRCLLEECKIEFKSPEERREHCITEHKLPADFRYGLMIKKTKNDKNVEEEEETTMQVDKAVSEKSKKFTFGHKKEKMFNQKSALNLEDLKNALPE